MPQNNAIVRNNRGQFAPAVRRPFPQDPKIEQPKAHPLEAEARLLGMPLSLYKNLCLKAADMVERNDPSKADFVREVRAAIA